MTRGYPLRRWVRLVRKLFLSLERSSLMRSRVRAAGHAVHPILIVFPLGLLTTAVGFDVLHLVTSAPASPSRRRT